MFGSGSEARGVFDISLGGGGGCGAAPHTLTLITQISLIFVPRLRQNSDF